MDQYEENMIEQLLEQDHWVIDFLPVQVRPDGKGQFFAVERYYLTDPRLSDFRRRMADVLIKLNCYDGYRVAAGEDRHMLRNPPPERLAALIGSPESTVIILLETERALITLDKGDLYATVYGPSNKLLSLIGQLAYASGLFVRKPEDRERENGT